MNNGSGTTQGIEHMALELAKLRKDYTDAIAFLPAYDQRQYDKQLKELEAGLDTLRASSAPKSKFVFKRKAGKPATSAPVPAYSAAAPASDPAAASAQAPTSGLLISGHSHKYLTLVSLSSPWSSASDLTISDLDHCIVNLVPSDANTDAPSDITFTALHARNLSNTILMLPIITGSALLHDLNNCVIALGSRQFRMHTSSQVDVYIAISSNPIIEHCSAVRFADYPTPLRRTCGTHADTKSNYLSVQDFSHIRATASPNWSALSADDKDAAEWPLAAGGNVDTVLQHLLPSSIT
ncbi:tubulin binding cofactor C-domain-containing protein [Fomes fomentarius]|nr:tubulin binding cofactor C-domain-containing protein [Fomes fomentarius]